MLLKAKFFFLVSSFVFLGCASSFHQEITGLPLDPVKKEQQQNEIEGYEKSYDNGQTQEALQGFQRFKSANPSSPYFRRAQLGEAKSLETLGFWSEALTQYHDLIESTRQNQPEIAGEGLFYSSYCYEALGDEAKVLAVLQDAQRMGSFLRPEILQAELPARLAASYQRLGMLDQVKKYLSQADAGIQLLKVNGEKELESKFLARIYQQMGSHSTNQLSFEGFQNNLETLKTIQIYALKSIEVGDPVYSQKALTTLKANYRDLVNLIQQVPFNKALDFAAAKREQLERKSQIAGQILAAIENLKRLKTLAEIEPPLSKDLFAYLAEVEVNLNGFLNQRGELNELTSEALRLKSLKKDIIIKSEPLFPNEGK